MVKITYITYNNKDFEQTAFAKNKKEALQIKQNLEKLKHVSCVKINEKTVDLKSNKCYNVTDVRA